MRIDQFVTARLDERMAALRRLEDGHCEGFEMAVPGGAVVFSTRAEMADIIAKRRIVEECCEHTDEDAWEHDRARASTLAYDVLYLLARPYQDHPDFDTRRWLIP